MVKLKACDKFKRRSWLALCFHSTQALYVHLGIYGQILDKLLQQAIIHLYQLEDTDSHVNALHRENECKCLWMEQAASGSRKSRASTCHSHCPSSTARCVPDITFPWREKNTVKTVLLSERSVAPEDIFSRCAPMVEAGAVWRQSTGCLSIKLWIKGCRNH